MVSPITYTCTKKMSDSQGENCLGLKWLDSKAGKFWSVGDKLARTIQFLPLAVCLE